MSKPYLAFACVIVFATFQFAAEARSYGSDFATGVGPTLSWLLPDKHRSNFVLAQASTTQKKVDKQPAKKRGMKRIPPPVLKGDSGPPVHDVRKDLSYLEVDQLRFLQKRLLNPDKFSMAPKAVEKDYDRLYRKLYKQRENLIGFAEKEPNRKVKTEQLKQALLLSRTLNSINPPASAKPKDFPIWDPVYGFIVEWRNSEPLYDIAISEATRKINSTDKEAAFRELNRLVDLVSRTKNAIKRAKVAKRDFLDTGIYDLDTGIFDLELSGAVPDHFLQKLQAEMKKYDRLVEFTKDYEKALKRKWPPQKDDAKDTPQPGALNYPEIGPLPSVVGGPGPLAPIQCPLVSGC